MRIWDIQCNKLCDKHLLGEHRELHAIFTYLTTDKGGSYKKHPETLRWVNKCGLLSERHTEQVEEMKRRGWNHKSPLDASKVDYGDKVQDKFVNTLEQQIEILKAKGCKYML